MEYPVVLKRKRTGTIIVSAVFSAVTLFILIIGLVRGEAVGLYAFALVVFVLSLGFNIFLVCEKSVVIDRDKFSVVSVFMPKITIPAADIKSVEYTDEKKNGLKINYDLPEFDMKKLIGDSEDKDNSYEGMWSYVITSKDVNRPLSEVKFILQDVILSR